MPGYDYGSMRFEQSVWLPLLAAPALLLLLWVWRFGQRIADRRGVRRLGAQRIGLFGDLLSWLLILAALAATIAALARPVTVVSTVRTAGVDLVVLQDASASMRVADVRGDRWGRSMTFLRALGEALRWEDDRVGLALFASMATPQIRLTRDPNTFFFFLDHLDDEPPFRLQDPGTWDTNIERGIYWGLRLVQRDEELLGVSDNARAFVLISDGQAWSGEVETSLSVARARGIPVHVIGVGTTAGGVIPEPQRASADRPVVSRLDRESLATIATAGGGRYFELDRERDADIANAIVAATRRRAPRVSSRESLDDLYPQCLAAAAVLLVFASAARFA